MIDRNDLRDASNIDGLLKLLGKLNYYKKKRKGIVPWPIKKIFEFPGTVNESLEKGGGIYGIGNVGDVEVLLLKYATLKERDLRQLTRISALEIAKKRPEKDFLTIHYSQDGRHIRFTVGYRDKKGRMVIPKIATVALDTKEPTRFMVEKIKEIRFNGQKDFYSALITALSKEELTKRFYKEYATVLDYIAEGIAEANPTISEFDKPKGHKKEHSLALTKFCLRLMGRVMFLYFLQEKMWLQKDKNFLGQVFDEYLASGFSKRQNSFYERYLSIIFFDVLNTPKKQREREATKWEYIPYLNGSLFQPSKIDRAVKIPDWCFKKSASNDKRIAKDGIMDFFEKYHFTIASETADEKEVALDPDMLGQVYENILQDEERHKRGAFYTPRSVVHYMSRHALARYLADRLDQNFRIVLNWIDGREKFPRHLLIDAAIALDELRIIDPAIGSGGFATGILYEILEWRLLLWRVEQNLDAEYPPARQLQEWKWQTIRDSLFGVDIKEEAVEVTKLRLWLSLLVDDETDVTQDDPHTLPNLELNFVVGDSLFDRSPRNVPPSLKTDKLLAFRKKYFKTPAMSDDDIPEQFSQYFTEGKAIYGDQSYDIARFGGIFGDIMENGGFHIVMTNPPYGKDEDHRAAEEHLEKMYGLESRDKYGPFLIQGMNLLRKGGLLAYVTSDTWRTIKSHLPLREQLLSKCRFREMVSLPPWTFQATVNTMIVFIQNLPQADQKMRVIEASYLRERDQILLETMLQQLTDLTRAQDNAPEWAYVPEDPNKPKLKLLPLFIEDPSFCPLFDATLPLSDVEVGLNKFRARELIFNGKKLQLLELGDVVDGKQGLATGDNDYYLRQKEEVHGSYKIIDEKLILKDDERAGLTAEEKLNGVDPKKYGGRHFVPYDKGGESDVKEGWLPNWFVPTPYFIDWSKSAVKRLKTLTIAERKRLKGEVPGKGDEKICSHFQNPHYYFRSGITYSMTGVYAPTFRLNHSSVFDVKGSCLFPWVGDSTAILCFLCSKTFKYLLKTFCNHTVDNHLGYLLPAPVPVSLLEDSSLEELGKETIRKKKRHSRVDVSDLEDQIEEIIMGHFRFTEAQREEILRWYSLKYGIAKKETPKVAA